MTVSALQAGWPVRQQLVARWFWTAVDSPWCLDSYAQPIDVLLKKVAAGAYDGGNDRYDDDRDRTWLLCETDSPGMSQRAICQTSWPS